MIPENKEKVIQPEHKLKIELERIGWLNPKWVTFQYDCLFKKKK